MNLRLLLKLCAVASSLLLVVAFVSYRAGALDWLNRPSDSSSAKPVEPLNASEDPASLELVTVPSDGHAGEQIIYGSKSAPVFVESNLPSPSPQQVTPAPAQSAPASAEDRAIIMSGSKSLSPSSVPPGK